MTENIRTSALLLLLIFTASSAWAQKTVRGTVTDAQSGETLPSTNIMIEDTYRGTITNENGIYSLTIPEAQLPATLVVRYIGYKSQRRTITAQSSASQNFALEPSVSKMEEIVVTDEDPGARIMREVIKRKQQWRKKLQTYRADAYTRQNLANDTSIVSIVESASEIFWDKEQGHREVQKSKRQTANIEATENLAGVRYLPNFYDDNIEIANFQVVGVTHPDALEYYNFKLVDQTSMDDRTVYKIRVTPDRKLQPLFKGTLFVLDEAYALLEVDLKPNDVINFPRPVQSFKASYKQQFNNFGQDFWLPVDVRIRGDIKISMVGLDFPTIKFKQLSRITNYKVNTELPDSLYEDDDVFTVDSSTVSSDSLITRQLDTVPLSTQEEKAYATLDSTATLEKAFQPSGFLSGMVDDDDSGSGLFDFMEKVPGDISPDLRYNRVDELFAGLRYSINATERLELRTRGGYSTGYEEWNYGGGFTLQWLDGDWIESSVGWNYAARTATRFNSYIYKPYYTIIPNLFGDRGYFDYYRSEGYRAFSKWELADPDLSLELGFSSKDHSSLVTTTAYDILGKDNNFRTNPPIEEGRLQSVDIITGYNLDEGYNFGVTTLKQIRFEIEHSSNMLGSDYDFTRYTGRISWSFPTFYQRRFLSNTLDVNLSAGTYSGDLPFQRWGIVDATIGESAPYGVMKATRGRPYEGEQYLAVNMEHNFRTIPFEALGINALIERDIGLIVFGGAAKTWLNSSSPPQGYQPKVTDNIHWEAGASINGILGLFRLDFAARLDEPAFLLNLSVARLF